MRVKEKKDSEQFLYKLKYIYLKLILVFISVIVGTYVLPMIFPSTFTDSLWAVVTDAATNSTFIEHTPESIGMTIINFCRNLAITGLVSVILFMFYEYRFEKEEKQSLMDGVNTLLSKNIEPHIIHAVLASKEVNEQLIPIEWIDEILKVCLIRKTKDEGKASAIIKSLLENVINQSMTIHELDVSMTLNNFYDKQHKYCAYSTYKMTYVIRYKVFLDTDIFVFMLTNNLDVQSKNLGAFAFCQFIDSSFSGQEVYFNVNKITIDGIPLERKKSREICEDYVKEQYWSEHCREKMGKLVQVVYSVDFLIRKNGNHYSYFTPAMTNGIHLKFDVSKTDIKRIKLLPYFNSGEKPTILTTSGDKNNPKAIEITLSDWVLPLSGSAFIWQFEKK